MGTIKSSGWIDSELQLSLSALAGQQQRFYDFIRNGTFTGGSSTYSNLNEGQPYYLQAAAAAVFTTDVPDLRKWVDQTFDYLLSHQADDGWFGPDPRILWPRWPILIGAIHYCEGAPEKSSKVVDFIYKFVNVSHSMLTKGKPGDGGLDDAGTTGLEEWGGVRTAEYTFVLQWLYENHPRDNDTQAMLLSDMTLIREMGAKKIGDFDSTGWTGFFSDQNFNKDGNGPRNVRSHGVNVAMALKEAALKWRVTGKDADKSESRHNWDIVYKYHGKAAGHFAADEHLAGFSPDRGAETCQVVENMWSASLTYATFGENQDADRAEMLAFNSLPAAMTGDWWGRQYLQQEIQLSSQAFQTNPFASDGGESNIFGLETNYPCCTVNHPQGLPRFISRAFLRREASKGNDEMLLHAYLIPSVVATKLDDGNAVVVKVNTNYPFEDQVRYSFEAAKPFSFGVRIPGWAQRASFTTQGGAAQALAPNADGIVTINVPAGTSDAAVTLVSEIVVTPTQGGSGPGAVSVTKGALLYALPLEYTLKKYRQNAVEPKAVDNLRLPSDKDGWKMAIDPSTAQFVDKGGEGGGKLSSPLFDDGKAPVAIQVQGCAVPDGWDPVDDGAWNRGFPPSDANCSGSKTSLTLQPYGAAKLHMGTMAAMVKNKEASSSSSQMGSKVATDPPSAVEGYNFRGQRPFLYGKNA